MPKAAVKTAKSAAKSTKPDLDSVFAALRPVFAPHESAMTLQVNQPGKFYLVSRTMMHNKKPVWFGGLEIKKNYVSLHLVPVYMYAELTNAISPELKKRKQGKGCFNFDKVPAPEIVKELTALTKKGAEFFAANKAATAKCD
jgi:hypothetical protein